MNIEHIEAQLNSFNGQRVVVVKPCYGNVTESYLGELSLEQGVPMLFNILSLIPLRFDSTDIKGVESYDRQGCVILIRLKGPRDYLTNNNLQVA